MLPKISLVTPSYNQAKYLASTLDSVLGQNYPRLDYVVVDGGSTDGSRELISARASQLAWWCSEPDSGMYDAINKGFAKTDGEIMGWINSDDLMLRGGLHTVGEIFARFPDIRWLASLTGSTWTPRGFCVGTSSLPGFSRAAFLDGCYLPGGMFQYGWIPQESTFWRRCLWEQAGAHVDASLKLAGDFELWARFYQHAELVGTPSPIGGFRSHPSQKSRAMEAYLAESRPVLASVRKAARYRTPIVRSLLLRSGLGMVPGLRSLLASSHGYSAEKIIADPCREWRQVIYRFL